MLNRLSSYISNKISNNSEGNMAVLRKNKVKSSIRTMVVFNDVHIPFHHVAGCNNVLQLCKDIKPDNVVINGDFLDCYSLSSFPKAAGMPNMQEELDIGAEFLQTLRRNCPNAQIDYLEGNHEERLKRIVKERASAFSLRALTIPALLGLDKLNIAYHAYKQPVDFGPLTITHGHRVSKHSGTTAKSHLMDDGYRNVIVGHTHRMGSYFHTGHTGTRRAYENGGLYDAAQLEYVVEPNWQNGFAIVYLNDEDPDFLQIVPVEMDRNCSFVWAGKQYGGK